METSVDTLTTAPCTVLHLFDFYEIFHYLSQYCCYMHWGSYTHYILSHFERSHNIDAHGLHLEINVAQQFFGQVSQLTCWSTVSQLIRVSLLVNCDKWVNCDTCLKTKAPSASSQPPLLLRPQCMHETTPPKPSLLLVVLLVILKKSHSWLTLMLKAYALRSRLVNSSSDNCCSRPVSGRLQKQGDCNPCLKTKAPSLPSLLLRMLNSDYQFSV